ncbi:biliverdin-producing heme oxygenase [Sphingobium sp. H39-3-25]|uniref:biliverdin-producing heme oxygenase n=1 Tax=Sphingobium arseniciresistens TaxID=3030834 RepID=UPI0023B8F3F6|nr:biliverdin-producing heme oxygenase [Sphingobium arseniciresistens]
MIVQNTARMALRTATGSHHERVDSLFSKVRFDDRMSYGQFLRAQAAAYLPTENALSRSGIDAIVPDWQARQRNDLLCADLADLGLEPPTSAGDLDLDGEEASLGALYVLEGSRLGGAMLKRSVSPDFPVRFLGGGDSTAWRSLLALLEERLDTDVKRATSIKAARHVFMLFEAGAHEHLKAI